MAARRHRARRSRGSKPPAAEAAAPPGPRPIWSGTISFGLVAVPVDLHPAVRPAGTSLRLLGPDGAPLQRRYVCPEQQRDVGWDELVRGFEVGDDRYVQLGDEELEAAEPRKSRDIDLRLFVPAASLDPFLFERAYVLTPGGDSNKPYRLIAEVMQREAKAGIATFVMRTKEYLVAILARQGILWAETLRFAGELRTPRDVGLPAPAAPGKRQVAAFVREVEALAQPHLDRAQLVDRRQQRLQQLVADKERRGKDVVEAPAAAGDAEAEAEAAPDLFDSIRRSLRLLADGKSSRRRGGDGLAALSKDELYERAQAADLPGRSSMTKAQLAAALQRRG